jgi:novobiocin biosynthesis protein NovU/D-mycarose 3-C-methyltransferase
MAEELISFLGRTGLAVDVGSNDGLLLSYLQQSGWRVVGVDPASNITRQANEAGIYTVNDFWNRQTATFIKQTQGQADLITGTNVFAHVDDVRGFVQAVKELLKPEGIFVIEVPYLPVMLEDATFDLIYHEHLSYFALAPLVRLFASEDLDVFRVEDVPIHGGSIRVFVQRRNGPFLSDGVANHLTAEKRQGLGEPRVYERFARRVAHIKEELVESVLSLNHKGFKLVGYGAPAKANTLINYCRLEARHIAYIVDDSPLKQGKYLPGSHIPIVPSCRLQAESPDAIVVFAWNVAEDIIPKLPPGKTVIVPMPVLKVIESPTHSISTG